MELTVTIMMIPPHRVYRWFRLPTEDSRMKAAISPLGSPWLRSEAKVPERADRHNGGYANQIGCQ